MSNNQLLASDNFASGSLAAGWVVFPNASGHEPSISSGPPYYTQSFSNTVSGGVIWTGLTWPNDQTSEITVHALTADANHIISAFVRVNAAGTAGYQMSLSNGTVLIRNYATGANLASGSVTVSAGDVFALQAAGCAITIYQNWKQILFLPDATFPTGGSPGFGIATLNSAAIAGAQVASWRGYNAIQQDGIWQKQGVVLAPNATDLASSGQGLYGGSFIYDTNPQLISPNPDGKVYKNWFSGGTPGSSGTYYAESPDLRTWTRKAAQVIAGYVGAMMIKVGSTYYSYSQLEAGAGSGNCALHTSPASDGLTWTLVSANVFTAPGGFFYPLRPITVIAGTWYALYCTAADSSFKAVINLATSTDGQTWTAYGSNPVLSNANYGIFTLQAWALVNGTYYFWHNVGPSQHQTTGANKFFLPGETARYSTADFIHWSGPVRSLHHSDQYEGLNEPTGVGETDAGAGLNPCAIFDIAGKATVIGQAEVLDGAGGGTQFSIAVATAPIASIVTQNEDAVSQVATDAFTSGAGDLSGNWTLPTGGTKLKIIAGPYVEPTATSTVCQAVRTAESYAANQYSEITLQAVTGTLGQSFISPTVRSSISALTDYEAQILSPSATDDAGAAIYKRVAGTPTQIGPTAFCTPTVSDVWRLSVIDGSDGFPVLSLFQNGSMILQVQDQSATPLTTGNPGIAASSSVAIADAQIASWAGGNANVIPSYPSTFVSTRELQALQSLNTRMSL